MDGYEVEIIFDRSVLDSLINTDKYSMLLRYLINQHHDTKAVVLKEDWKGFQDYWELQLKAMSEEAKTPFFEMMRGLITPYRPKYAEEADGGDKLDFEEGLSSVDKILKIANRHYATVCYLVVSNPEEYKKSNNLIATETIFDPKQIYFHFETNYPEVINKVNSYSKQFGVTE